MPTPHDTGTFTSPLCTPLSGVSLTCLCAALQKASLRGSVRCIVQTGVGRGPRDRHWRLEKDDSMGLGCGVLVAAGVGRLFVVTAWVVPQCLVVQEVL